MAQTLSVDPKCPKCGDQRSLVAVNSDPNTGKSSVILHCSSCKKFYAEAPNVKNTGPECDSDDDGSQEPADDTSCLGLQGKECYCENCTADLDDAADIDDCAGMSKLLDRATEIPGKYTVWVSGNVPVEFEKVTELSQEWVTTVSTKGVMREIQISQILWVEVEDQSSCQTKK